jgi:hypothetical protein
VLFHVPKTIDNDLRAPTTARAMARRRVTSRCLLGDNVDNRSLPGIKVNM